MKYKVIVAEDVNGSGRNGITAVSFYTFNSADAYARSTSSTFYGEGTFVCYLWNGETTQRYLAGSPQ